MSDQQRYTAEEAALNTARHEVFMAEYRLTGEVTESEAFADRIDAAYRANVRAQVLREAADVAHALDSDPSNDPYLWSYGGSKIVEKLRRMAEEGEAR